MFRSIRLRISGVLHLLAAIVVTGFQNAAKALIDRILDSASSAAEKAHQHLFALDTQHQLEVKALRLHHSEYLKALSRRHEEAVANLRLRHGAQLEGVQKSRDALDGLVIKLASGRL